MSLERYNARELPPTLTRVDISGFLRQEFQAIQRAIPSTLNRLTYGMLPTGSGSWDSGAATTITITRALTVSGGPLTVSANGITITAGGLTVSAGGAAVTGNSTVTGTLTVTSTLTPQALVDISGAGAGQIKFPATQNASADANTLDDFEEGSWTPTDASGAALTLSSAAGTYMKVARLVIAFAAVTWPSTVDASNASIGSLPFTVANTNETRQGFISQSTETTAVRALPTANGTTLTFQNSAGSGITNATLSTDTLFFTCIYHI